MEKTAPIFYPNKVGGYMPAKPGTTEPDKMGMMPSITAAQSIAKLVDTTVGYLLGETEETNVLKDPTMLKRLNEISTLPDDDRLCIIYAIDGLLQNVRTKQAFG